MLFHSFFFAMPRGMWDLSSLTRIEPWPPEMLQWKHAVLTTGQQGKSCYLILISALSCGITQVDTHPGSFIFHSCIVFHCQINP